MVKNITLFLQLNIISKIQLVVYYQCCILIGWATTILYVIAHLSSKKRWLFGQKKKD